MGSDKRTLKIVLIVVSVLLTLGLTIGLLLAYLLWPRYVELEVWPRSEEHRWDEPLIHFKTGDAGSWNPWVERINDFLRAYETTVPEEPPRAPCSVQRREQRLPAPGCEAAMAAWGPCTIDYYYGYPQGSPCVFLRLNNIHYWVPEPYNVSVSMSTPPDMPEFIKQMMHARPAHVHGDYVWVSCGGEFPADEENIGPLQYYSSAGFPAARLLTANRIPYAARAHPDPVPAPLVAVAFENPRRGMVINVECRIWTRDIYYDRSSYSRVGRTRFELYIE